MKKLFFMTVMLAFIFACKEKPKNPVAEYGNVMMDSCEKGMQGGEMANLDAVKKVIQAYHAANDKYPVNLEEVQPLIGSEMDFSKYDYNSENGTVTIKGN